MKKKDVILNFRPNDKLVYYLSCLGLIDLKTGRQRKSSKQNISKFINHSLIKMIESEKSLYKDFASKEELMKSWMKYQIGEHNFAINQVMVEYQNSLRLLKEEEELKKDC